MQLLLPLHGIFMALALGLIISAVIVAHRRKGNWFFLHRLLGILGIVSGFIAVKFVYALKDVMHYPHFTSEHGEFGLAILFSLIIVIIIGFIGSKGVNFLKKVHIILAKLVAAVMIVVAIIGLVEFLKILHILK